MMTRTTASVQYCHASESYTHLPPLAGRQPQLVAVMSEHAERRDESQGWKKMLSRKTSPLIENGLHKLRRRCEEPPRAWRWADRLWLWLGLLDGVTIRLQLATGNASHVQHTTSPCPQARCNLICARGLIGESTQALKLAQQPTSLTLCSQIHLGAKLGTRSW